MFRELAARSEAVLHLVDHSGGGSEADLSGAIVLAARALRRRPLLVEAAERTGGTLQTQSFFFRSSSLFRAFKTIFDDFRQSYILRYSPTGVEPRAGTRSASRSRR